MKLKKTLAILLVAAMVFALTGCLGNLYPTVMTVDGVEIPAGLYLMLQLSAYNEAKNMAEDPNKSVLKQTVEGEGASSWIQSRTEELARRYVAVERLCTERNISLSQDNLSYLSENMQYWDMLEDHYTQNGVSQATLRNYLMNTMLAEQLFVSLYGEGGELAPDDADLQSEYGEHNAHIRFLSVPLSNTAGQAVENPDEVVAKIDEIVAGMNADGTTLEEVARGDMADVYEMLGRSYNADTVASAITTSYIDYAPANHQTYSEEFLTSLAAQDVGDYGYYRMSGTVLVYEKIPTFESEEEFANMRESVLFAMRSDDFEDYLREQYQNYAVDVRPGATWYYRPSKVVE